MMASSPKALILHAATFVQHDRAILRHSILKQPPLLIFRSLYGGKIPYPSISGGKKYIRINKCPLHSEDSVKLLTQAV